MRGEVCIIWQYYSIIAINCIYLRGRYFANGSKSRNTEICLDSVDL